MGDIHPGPRNRITDVPGILVGNAHDPLVRSGVTALICEEDAAVAAVDIKGGGPGTRDTDALAPGGLVGRADAVVLSGGSAFGLDAAGGVQGWLAERGRGFDTGAVRIPIVPSAILYDMANGGCKEWGSSPPYRDLALQAAAAAGAECEIGSVGAGYGASAGSLQGGLGSASARDPMTGVTIGALAAVNPFGEVVAPDGRFLAAPLEIGEEFGGVGISPERWPREPDFAKSGFDSSLVPFNTTLGVVACDADLVHSDTIRLAAMAQAGLARAIRPVFTPFDGDIVFALATGRGPTVDGGGLTRLGMIAADCLARAIAIGVYCAATIDPARPCWRNRFSSLYA